MSAQLQRVEGPPPIEGVPEGASVLVECPSSCGGVNHYVLAWTHLDYGDDEDVPTLENWYENERGVSGLSNVIAHYRLTPPGWAQETNS